MSQKSETFSGAFEEHWIFLYCSFSDGAEEDISSDLPTLELILPFFIQLERYLQLKCSMIHSNSDSPVSSKDNSSHFTE